MICETQKSRYFVIWLLPGDLVTSLRETGEKMLLPYPIRQPARSREFAVIARANVDAFQILALYHDSNSDLCFK